MDLYKNLYFLLFEIFPLNIEGYIRLKQIKMVIIRSVKIMTLAEFVADALILE